MIPKIPLIPAKAGTQIRRADADWRGPARLAPASSSFHLGPGLRRDERGVEPAHQRIFRVARPTMARTMEMIQKRITTVDSFQPSFSKWWWIGAIRKMRLPPESLK